MGQKPLGVTASNLDAQIDIEDNVNIHSVFVSVAIEPISAGSNARGVVVLYTRKQGTTTPSSRNKLS